MLRPVYLTKAVRPGVSLSLAPGRVAPGGVAPGGVAPSGAAPVRAALGGVAPGGAILLLVMNGKFSKCFALLVPGNKIWTNVEGG